MYLDSFNEINETSNIRILFFVFFCVFWRGGSSLGYGLTRFPEKEMRVPSPSWRSIASYVWGWPHRLVGTAGPDTQGGSCVASNWTAQLRNSGQTETPRWWCFDRPVNWDDGSNTMLPCLVATLLNFNSKHHSVTTSFTRNYMAAWRTWRRPPTSSLLLDWSCRRTRRRRSNDKYIIRISYR